MELIFANLAQLVDYISRTIEYVGLAIVIVSVVTALVRLPTKKYSMENVREALARKIIFGLEFVIAADILLATVATDFNDILRLGGIVVIRILLGYALRKEVIAPTKA